MQRSAIHTLISFIKHRIASKKVHGIHSPFVYRLTSEVLYEKLPNEITFPIEQRRKTCMNDTTLITVTDYGEGSSSKKKTEKKINEICKRSVKPAKQMQLLYQLVNFLQPETIIELGTSLGISTAYLSKANMNAAVYTIEGCPAIAQYAQETFNSLHCKNVTLINKPFDDCLNDLLNNVNSASLVYFDGNHNKRATLKYFNLCLEKATPESVFIFDDINWSEGMQQAWKEIISSEPVTVSLDFFYFGVVFFRKGQEKENFLLRI